MFHDVASPANIKAKTAIFTRAGFVNTSGNVIASASRRSGQAILIRRGFTDRFMSRSPALLLSCGEAAEEALWAEQQQEHEREEEYRARPYRRPYNSRYIRANEHDDAADQSALNASQPAQNDNGE